VTVPAMCPQVADIWQGLSSDVDVTVEDALRGLADHCARHGCDVNDAAGVLIDVCVQVAEDPDVIVAMAAAIEAHGTVHEAWRSALVGSLGTVVDHAADRGSAAAFVARREHHRLRRLWDLPLDVGLWTI